ncbi:deoxyuridine 5'-triphosphate nucleotidohydrolase, mitochondrial-like isoform X2 [Pollicipes pollicipes]|uniref:deoxyuridine 5'-triphosphate nucleotidohydrolase, mitochondrial-like isoform X2 n=1 Tax=Pollicipes pollicipes TaxID=41117 RepID=UPI001885222D|nr:deoxyuridine 5'-triphosphate nucleotidohydrolase, mitochondrial-like isoform X2 [Pollicipes pollicipes]
MDGSGMPLTELDQNMRSDHTTRSPHSSPSEMGSPARTVLRCVRLSPHAILPKRGSQDAAGYDLYSAHDCVVPAQGKALVKTDIQVQLPAGCYGRVAPRSGLAWKQHIDIGAGVIDRDYRGNVGVVMFNHGREELAVKRGDRVAQLILERIFYPDIEEVQELDQTERGDGGFGSSGKQ